MLTETASHSFYVEGEGHTFEMQELLYWAGPRTVSLIKHIRFLAKHAKILSNTAALDIFRFSAPFLVLVVDCISVTVIEN